MKKNNKKGFTLAELLIVVAIIAVLVAVAIPVFTAQLQKSRQATDAANIRSAYATAVTEQLTNGGSVTISTVPMVHTGGWSKISATTVGTLKVASLPDATKGKVMKVSIDKDGKVTVAAAS